MVIGNPASVEPELDALQLFLKELSRFALLAPADEVELAKRIERGDGGAKDRMINSNLRLVVMIAKRYQRPQLPLLDLIQEGILGLIRASERFDWRQGTKFSTYATWWIRESIERGLANRARMIRMPVYMIERERTVTRAERSLVAQLGREPTGEEVAAVANLPLEQVEEVRVAARNVTSLDEPVGAEQDASVGDLLASQESQPPEEVEASFRREILRTALSRLPQPERRIVELRYGIDDDQDPKSLEEVVQPSHLRGRGSRRIARRTAAPARARASPRRQDPRFPRSRSRDETRRATLNVTLVEGVVDCAQYVDVFAHQPLTSTIFS